MKSLIFIHLRVINFYSTTFINEKWYKISLKKILYLQLWPDNYVILICNFMIIVGWKYSLLSSQFKIMDVQQPSDVRVDFLGNCVQKTMKLKPEKWLRLLGIEEYKSIVMDFLDSSSSNLLIISQVKDVKINERFKYKIKMKKITSFSWTYSYSNILLSLAMSV